MIFGLQTVGLLGPIFEVQGLGLSGLGFRVSSFALRAGGFGLRDLGACILLAGVVRKSFC